MNLVIDKPFRDARSSTLYKKGDVVVQANTQTALTWIAIGVAHEIKATTPAPAGPTGPAAAPAPTHEELMAEAASAAAKVKAAADAKLVSDLVADKAKIDAAAAERAKATAPAETVAK